VEEKASTSNKSKEKVLFSGRYADMANREITVDKLPEEVLLAKQIMKVIGKRNPKIVLKAIMIVLKTTEVVELIEGGKK
jgi:hypothetical protein